MYFVTKLLIFHNVYELLNYMIPRTCYVHDALSSVRFSSSAGDECGGPFMSS